MSSTSSTSTKFRVSEKTPELFKKSKARKTEKHLITESRLYRKNYGIDFLQGTTFSSTTISSHNNGFVNTVVECYNHHYNLVIRPDDIWTAILTQFSFYINANAEKYRKEFVNFEGKKELTVSVGGSLRNAPYDLCVSLMTEEIHKNLVDGEVKSWILPNFSTTTKDDLITYGAVFMAAMKKYFDYGFCLCCGIPWMTLEGTIQDWENILSRLEKLKSYDLEKWFNLLEPILKQFVEAKKGNVDLNFWQKICHQSGGGSGPTYLSGWISAFCVYDIDGNWQGVEKMWFEQEKKEGQIWPYVDLDKIPSGVVEVDVKIDDNGTPYHSVLLAGHMAVDIIEDEETKCTMKPQIGWALVLKPSPDEMEQIKLKEEEERKW